MLHEEKKRKHHQLTAYFIYSTTKSKINNTSVTACMKLSAFALSVEFRLFSFPFYFSGKGGEGILWGSDESKLHP